MNRSTADTVRHALLVVAAIAAGAALLIDATGHGGAQQPQRSPALVGDGWTGKSAPDFALNTLDGRRVRLSDYRGKVVIVNFWATWCGPCKVEMPWLVEFYTRYRAQGLEIIGVSVDDGDRERVEKFLRERNVNYTILLKDKTVSDAYGGVRFLPQTFFVGRDGKIIERTYGIRGRSDFETDVRGALGMTGPYG